MFHSYKSPVRPIKNKRFILLSTRLSTDCNLPKFYHRHLCVNGLASYGLDISVTKSLLNLAWLEGCFQVVEDLLKIDRPIIKVRQ